MVRGITSCRAAPTSATREKQAKKKKGPPATTSMSYVSASARRHRNSRYNEGTIMANVPLIRTMQIAAAIFAFGFIASGQTPAAEQGTPVIQLVAGDSNSRFVPLGVGKSIVIDLPRDIKDVLVADPTIANALARTARR